MRGKVDKERRERGERGKRRKVDKRGGEERGGE